MTDIIPCAANQELTTRINDFAERLKVEAHKLGPPELNEQEFYNSGLFRGAIERIRGQYSATKRNKREFIHQILGLMQDNGYIRDWELPSSGNGQDYSVTLKSGKVAVIQVKGCLDGDNTRLFDKPGSADEFVIWSLCTNPGANPDKNAWSGIHTRLGKRIVGNDEQVDGVIVWDMICGGVDRPCPKITSDPARVTEVGPYKLPPPCIYVMESRAMTSVGLVTLPTRSINDVEVLSAFHNCFHGRDAEVNYVVYETAMTKGGFSQTTRIFRNGEQLRASKSTPSRRPR